MRSPMPGQERKNLSQDLKFCVVYNQQDTAFGPL